MEKDKQNLLKIAESNFEKWNDALLSKSAKKVASLYDKDNVFLPTVSPLLKKGIKEAEGYFKHFLEKNPSGKIIEDEVIKLSKDSFLHAGLYDFKLGPKNKIENVEARFTFLWKKGKDGKWKILHHHSSVKPK